MDKDDLDDFLYGNEEADQKPEEPQAASQSSTEIKHQKPEATEIVQEQEPNHEEESEEDDDEDEDDLEIVLDDTGNDIMQQTMQDRRSREAVQLVTSADGGNGDTQNLSMQQQHEQQVNKYGDVIPLQKHHININAVGEHEGRSILEIELDTIEEKQWRLPGADLTDYFNYGFDENTWRAYCIKQKQLRDEVHKGTLGASGAGTTSPSQQLFDVSIPPPVQQQQRYPPSQQQQQYGNEPSYYQQQRQRDGPRDNRRRHQRSRSPPQQQQRRYRSRSREDHSRQRSRRY